MEKNLLTDKNILHFRSVQEGINISVSNFCLSLEMCVSVISTNFNDCYKNYKKPYVYKYQYIIKYFYFKIYSKIDNIYHLFKIARKDF